MHLLFFSTIYCIALWTHSPNARFSSSEHSCWTFSACHWPLMRASKEFMSYQTAVAKKQNFLIHFQLDASMCSMTSILFCCFFTSTVAIHQSKEVDWMDFWITSRVISDIPVTLEWVLILSTPRVSNLRTVPGKQSNLAHCMTLEHAKRSINFGFFLTVFSDVYSFSSWLRPNPLPFIQHQYN